MADILAEHDGLIAFGGGQLNSRTLEYGFWAPAGWVPAKVLVGHMVNLAGKNGEVYEGVTVTMADDADLLIEGGRIGWPWQPERAPEPIAGGELLPVTEVARGFTRPLADVEAIRHLLMTKVELRYRFSGSLHHVAGLGREYGHIVALVNWLKNKPEVAEREGWVLREEFSAAAATQRADLLGYILAVLEGIDHDAPPEQIAAMETYLRALRGEGD